jgi:hypothetical protein
VQELSSGKAVIDFKFKALSLQVLAPTIIRRKEWRFDQ